MDKKIEIKLAKTYKSSLVNEKKLKDYLEEKTFLGKQKSKQKL